MAQQSQQIKRDNQITYKKGEGLLELGDLLFSKGVGLLPELSSARCAREMDAARLPLGRGAASQENRKLRVD